MNHHQHIVKSYDEEQHSLLDELVRMGKIANAQLDAALKAIECQDTALARQVVDGDAAIDALEQQINQDVIHLIRRGPLATDLRILLAALRAAADLERVGDYAANIAKRSIVLSDSLAPAHVRGLAELGKRASQQLRDVLLAYRVRNADAALRVYQHDAELDDLYTALFRELLTYMMEDPRAITTCTHLLFMAKNLERIGDHATNIAENVWFLVHGGTPLPPREKRDASSALAP